MNKESRLRNRRGEVVNQGMRTAAFAEYCIVDQSQVVRVPENMPLDRAALLACGVITGLGAVINTAQVEPGSSVVVIGTGGVGLNAVQGAALAGAHPIIAMDLLDNKLKAARGFRCYPPHQCRCNRRTRNRRSKSLPRVAGLTTCL